MRAIWNTLFSGAHCTAALLSISVILLIVFNVRFAQAGEAQGPPHIFYSDLTNGPAAGGESDQGAFVTIYGRGFGAIQGQAYATIGGARASSYPIWSDGKITFQIGKEAHTGEIVVHLEKGGISNSVPFVVRSGKIMFYAANRKETLQSAIDKLHAGDVLYVRDGVTVSTLDRYDASLNIMSSGRKDDPISVVAYPGAVVTIGSIDGPVIAARTPNVQRTSDHWVLAELHFRGNQEALDVTDSKDWRLVGNDFTCPHGFGPTGCVEMSQVSEVSFLGNTIHDVGKPGTTKVYHGLYFSTDSNHIDVGWNTIARVLGCRGLQFHSTPTDPGTGHNQYDLHIHDNVIHDTVCDGINLATVNPSAGPVEVFNNLLYNVGLGPDPPDGSANYSCVNVQGGANAGPPGSGIVEIYNNTMFRCGGRRNTDSGAVTLSAGSANQRVNLRDNIIVLDSGVPLLSPNSTPVPLRAQSNLIWWLPGSKLVRPRTYDGFQVADPMLHDPLHDDFHVVEKSPAIRGGVPTGLQWTLDGRARDSKLPSGMGAY